jgi:hypothetical protein
MNSGSRNVQLVGEGAGASNGADPMSVRAVSFMILSAASGGPSANERGAAAVPAPSSELGIDLNVTCLSGTVCAQPATGTTRSPPPRVRDPRPTRSGSRTHRPDWHSPPLRGPLHEVTRIQRRERVDGSARKAGELIGIACCGENYGTNDMIQRFDV